MGKYCRSRMNPLSTALPSEGHLHVRCPKSWNSGYLQITETFLWRHNGRDSVSNHHPHDCLLNSLFRRRSKKTSKFPVTGLCAGNSPGTGELPAQMASNAENVSISWRQHELFGHMALDWINTILCRAQIYPSTLGKRGNFSNLNIEIAQAVEPFFIKDITHPILCDTSSQRISSSDTGLILRERSGLISGWHCTYKTNILEKFLREW